MNIPSLKASFRRRFGATPPSLIAYTVFALVVTLTYVAVVPSVSDQLRGRLIAYTGWSAATPYPITLIFVFVLIFQEQRRRYVRVFGIAFPLAITIIFGAVDIFQFGKPNYNNPYLTISPLRPIWTMLIPAAWIIILYLPNLNCFCDQPIENKDAEEAV